MPNAGPAMGSHGSRHRPHSTVIEQLAIQGPGWCPGVARGKIHSMRFPIAIVAVSLILSACAPEAENANGVHWEEPVEVAAGGGHVGPWRMNDSDFRYVDDPTVALSPFGETAVAWVDQQAKDVFFQRYAGARAGLPEAVNVSKNPDTFSWLPRMVIGDSDQVYLLWQEIIFSGGTHGGEILFARSTDGGYSFSEPLNLSNTTNGAGKGRLTERHWHNGSLDLARGPEGNLYAAWAEYQGPLRLSRSTDGGETFSDPLLIAGGGEQPPTRGPSLATGPEGRLHLAWTVGGDPAADIRYATSVDAGRSFSEPRRIDPGEAHADAPKLAVHADGSVHLAWMASPEGVLRDYEISYTRRASESTNFPDPATISAPLPEGFDSAGFPQLELDGDGNPYALFDLFRNRSRRGTGLALTWSDDGGKTFTEPRIIPRGSDDPSAVNGSLQGLLMDKLAISPEGNVIVVNSTFEEGESSHVWLLRTSRPLPFPGLGK